MDKKVWISTGAIVLLVIAGGLAVFWPYRNGGVLRLPGIVEVQEVRLGSKVGGRVEAVLVNEGDLVATNQRLIVLEAPELKNQWKQMKARLYLAEREWQRAINGPRVEEKDAADAARNSARARYVRVKKGWRKEEIDQASSEYRSAQADYNQAATEFLRVSALHDRQAASRTEFDAAIAYRDRAKGRAEAAQFKAKMMESGSRPEDKADAMAEWKRAEANYALLQNGTRQEDKDIAQAKVDEIRAQLEAIEINLKETDVFVPLNLGKAVVEVIAIRPGDIVAPNQPIVRVLRVEDLWIKIFVPETQYGLVTLNKEVQVTIDSHPGKVLKGKVIQRSNISEFTPRNVQSVDERRHQVFGVKIRVDDPQGVLNAGMAAEVTIPRD